jgi:hypothetical protein
LTAFGALAAVVFRRIVEGIVESGAASNSALAGAWIPALASSPI